MIGTKHKTPKRPRWRRYRKSPNGMGRAADDASRKFGTHNDRHGKMGEREKIVLGKLAEQARLEGTKP